MKTNGKRTLGFVPGAENLLVTTDHRWFVSGNDGFYQIDPDGMTPPQRIALSFEPASAPSAENRSIFCGLAQYRNFVYATCTHDLTDPAAPRYIMFMDAAQSPANMRAIYAVSNQTFFNGMAADAAGNLYLTCYGALFPPCPGRIVKLDMASPTAVFRQSDWLEVAGHPNGIKIDADMVYFSQESFLFLGGHLKKVRIKADGKPDMPSAIHSAWIGTVLDDIELVDGGLVITQANLMDSATPTPTVRHYSPLNQIIHISESGQELHDSDVPFSLPSAVRLVPDSTDLIITERTGDIVRLSQDWGLRQRH